MTTGALIFAFDNAQIDYVAMASWCAANVKRHLNIPVAVVTDSKRAKNDANFDRVIYAEPIADNSRYFSDFGTHVEWKNSNRTDAYTLSPWDQTLVLDSDYVVASDDLNRVLESTQDFMCYRRAINYADTTVEMSKTFGDKNFPMWWATVMMFRRSNTAAYIFDSMTMIRQNWTHYRDLYGIRETTYRNDYALSIAIGIVSGHTLKVDSIPWPMFNCLPEQKLVEYELDHYEIQYHASDGMLKRFGFRGADFHAMGKKDLGEIVARTRLLNTGV